MAREVCALRLHVDEEGSGFQRLLVSPCKGLEVINYTALLKPIHFYIISDGELYGKFPFYLFHLSHGLEEISFR